jgi:hypothetical protein
MPKTRRALSDEERAERRRADRAFAAHAVEQLRSSEGWQQWLAARRHFHAYSLANQLLIAMQKPEATRVAGFRAWLKLGYCVRKGETALRIWCKRALSHLMRRVIVAASVSPQGAADPVA